jgi:hypothetical protein
MPNETNTPLIVDPDRMLSLSIGLQRLKPVAGRHAQIVEELGLVQETEFSQSNVLNVRW